MKLNKVQIGSKKKLFFLVDIDKESKNWKFNFKLLKFK